MASGITLIPDISQNTGISSGFGGISVGAGISGNNPNPVTAGRLLTDSSGNLLTDASGNLLTG